MLRFSSPGVYAWGNDKENRLLSPINGACNSCYLPPPGVNAWARERSSFKLGDYPGFINVSNKLLDDNNHRTKLPVSCRCNPGIWIEFNIPMLLVDRTTPSKAAKPPVTSEMTTEMFRMPLLQLCTRQTVFQRSARRGLRSNCNESTIMSGEKRHLERRHSKGLSFASSLRRIVQ